MQLGSDVTTCNQDNADAEMQGRPSSLKDLKDVPSVWNYLGNIRSWLLQDMEEHQEYVKQLYTATLVTWSTQTCKLFSCQSGCLLCSMSLLELEAYSISCTTHNLSPISSLNCKSTCRPLHFAPSDLRWCNDAYLEKDPATGFSTVFVTGLGSSAFVVAWTWASQASSAGSLLP